MSVKEITAKSIIRKLKKIDSWFCASYSLNLYRGCNHNCIYCDGRSEKYTVEGDFGKKVEVKINALELLQRELDPSRKMVPFKKGYFLLGGGVGDTYQKVEESYFLARKTLELLYHKGFPVHILTKSVLVERDTDLIKAIHKTSKAIVSFSFSSVDDEISSFFEPGAPSPSEKLETIRHFKKEGIPCGMFLLPVIPFITDSKTMIEKCVAKAADSGVDFIIFGGLTLKQGRQKEYFLRQCRNRYPEIIDKYAILYGNNSPWGNAKQEYYNSLYPLFDAAAKKYNIPQRIPLSMFSSIVSDNDRVILLLEHIDYFCKSRGMNSPYGYAAYSVSQIDKPLQEIRTSLRDLKGIGPVTERIILEILDTGISRYCQSLFNNSN